MLWIHGGGFVVGNASMDDALCRRFADQLGITVAAVDYRLAPVHPYPIPAEDCYDAAVWLADQPWVDPRRIVVAGASAGGGLAATVALLARDRREIDLAAQLLVYPMLDDRTSQRRDPHARYRRMWNSRSNDLGWRSYLGGADPHDAVPARSADLSGLPPTWIGVGTVDVLYDESMAYAHRLQSAGVHCELDVVAGAFHGFDVVARKTPVARSFFARQCDWLGRVLATD